MYARKTWIIDIGKQHTQMSEMKLSRHASDYHFALKGKTEVYGKVEEQTQSVDHQRFEKKVLKHKRINKSCMGRL